LELAGNGGDVVFSAGARHDLWISTTDGVDVTEKRGGDRE
jgi:hypothetical protein